MRSCNPENSCSVGDRVRPAHICLLRFSLGDAHRNCGGTAFVPSSDTDLRLEERMHVESILEPVGLTSSA